MRGKYILSALQTQHAVGAYYIFSFDTQYSHSPLTEGACCDFTAVPEGVDNDRSEGVTGRGLSDSEAVGGDPVGMETCSWADEL